VRAPALGFDEGEPRRVWHAIDAAGRTHPLGSGRELQVPTWAVGVRVAVGGRVVLEAPRP
jgi:hypothetical protein